MANDKMRIDAFLSEFGKSMIQAQAQINAEVLEHPVGFEGLQTGIAISETEIDLKMVFDEDSSGVNIRPVSAGEARLADLNPGVLSGLRARLVAVPNEEIRPPVRKPSDIREQVLSRPDITRLQDVFGELQVEPTYVGAARRWIVDVKEPRGQTLRSIQISDSE
ncbi:MAG: hypothetical protein RID09_05735 [Coleofasciculus sp. G1-WW12-02]|uniref:hypothetical protein n=2 Tax=Coleofasciculus TaxID=669368 RepID=UPI003303D034